MALKEGRDLARTVGGLYDGACRTIHIKGRDLLVINGGFGRSGRCLSPIGFGRRIDVVNTVRHGNERGLSTFSSELAAQIDEGVLIAIRLIFDCGGRRREAESSTVVSRLPRKVVSAAPASSNRLP